MFTKSGKKLVRIQSIPEKKNDLPLLNVSSDLPPPLNSVTKESKHVANGHIHSILDELVSRGCIVTPLSSEATAKEKQNNVPPDAKKKPASKEINFSEILPADDYSILNDVPKPKHKTKLNIQPRKTHSSVNSKANHQIRKELTIEEVFSAFKAKGSLTVPPPSSDQHSPILITDERTTPVESSLSKELPPPLEVTIAEPPSKAQTRKTINGTEYVPYTPDQNAVKRERAIQVTNIKKETLETAVQCGLIEDDEISSESSEESDWISDIIEEYEFIEDNNMYECQICGEVCPSRSSNLKHSMVHLESSLLCFRCGRLFATPSKLNAHEAKTYGNDKIAIKKALRCPKLNCLKAFHSKRQLFEHIEQHSIRVSEQRCSKCQRSFPTPLLLLSHVNRRNCWR